MREKPGAAAFCGCRAARQTVENGAKTVEKRLPMNARRINGGRRHGENQPGDRLT
jgi:hypothetical protein